MEAETTARPLRAGAPGAASEDGTGPPESPQGDPVLRHAELGLAASGTARGQLSVPVSPPVCGPSPRPPWETATAGEVPEKAPTRCLVCGAPCASRREARPCAAGHVTMSRCPRPVCPFQAGPAVWTNSQRCDAEGRSCKSLSLSVAPHLDEGVSSGAWDAGSPRTLGAQTLCSRPRSCSRPWFWDHPTRLSHPPARLPPRRPSNGPRPPLHRARPPGLLG